MYLNENVALPFSIVETDWKHKKNVSREGYIDDIYFRSKKFNIEYQGNINEILE